MIMMSTPIIFKSPTSVIRNKYVTMALGIAIATSGLFSCTSSKPEEPVKIRKDAYDLALEPHTKLFQPITMVSNEQLPENNNVANLGYYLYYDTRLSLKGNNSCNSCHNLKTFGVDNKSFSPGDEGKLGGRNSPSTFNAALHTTQFWDGRTGTIESQAGMPVLNPVEMNIPSEKFMVARLQSIPMYQQMFRNAFPNEKEPISYANMRKAIGTFEHVLVTPSRFDDYLNGNTEALTKEEKAGMLNFVLTGCATCHNGPAVGGNSFQKFGVHHPYNEYTKSAKIDMGRFDVSKEEYDRFYFKTPSLRNIAHTYPYFHDGSVDSLPKAIHIMAKVQLNKELSKEEVESIAAFLKTMTADIPDTYKNIPIELAKK